jgi:2'-5' RNA ligase
MSTALGKKKMKFAIELFFDLDTDVAVRREWDAISSVSGVRYMQDTSARPHVALSVFESDEIPPSVLIDDIARYSRPLSLTPVGLGSFPGGVLFVKIDAGAEVVQLQRTVTEMLLPRRVDVWAHYTPERWIPHCTLMQVVPSDLVDVSLNAVTQDFYRSAWAVRSIGLVNFPPTKLIEEKEWAQPTSAGDVANRAAPEK